MLLAPLPGPRHATAQTPSWPTPPPAPIESLPDVIPASLVSPVPAPETPGSIVLQVDPLFGGTLPRIPPRPYIPVFSGEADPEARITLEIEAGAINRTIQLRYQPLVAGAQPLVGPGRSVQRVFQIETFDHTGAPLALEFARPVRLRLRAAPDELAAAGNEPFRLLLARLDPESGTWLALVTVFDPRDNTLMTRIVRPGVFALIAQPPPVPR